MSDRVAHARSANRSCARGRQTWRSVVERRGGVKRRMQPPLRFCVLCLVVTDAVTRSPFSACSSSLPNAQGSRKRLVCVQCLKAKEDLTGCGTGVTPCFCVCVGWCGSATPALLETEQSKSERVTPSPCVDSGGKMLEATFDKTQHFVSSSRCQTSKQTCNIFPIERPSAEKTWLSVIKSSESNDAQ